MPNIPPVNPICNKYRVIIKNRPENRPLFRCRRLLVADACRGGDRPAFAQPGQQPQPLHQPDVQHEPCDLQLRSMRTLLHLLVPQTHQQVPRHLEDRYLLQPIAHV